MQLLSRTRWQPWRLEPRRLSVSTLIAPSATIAQRKRKLTRTTPSAVSSPSCGAALNWWSRKKSAPPASATLMSWRAPLPSQCALTRPAAALRPLAESSDSIKNCSAFPPRQPRIAAGTWRRCSLLALLRPGPFTSIPPCSTIYRRCTHTTSPRSLALRSRLEQVATWAKLNSGMIKMFEAEVLPASLLGIACLVHDVFRRSCSNFLSFSTFCLDNFCRHLNGCLNSTHI
jgi:hypothetical protein